MKQQRAHGIVRVKFKEEEWTIRMTATHVEARKKFARQKQSVSISELLDLIQGQKLLKL